MHRSPQERFPRLFAVNALLSWAAVAWLASLVLSGRRFPLPISSSMVEDPFPFYGAILLALTWGLHSALAALPRFATQSSLARLASFCPLVLACVFASIWYFRA